MEKIDLICNTDAKSLISEAYRVIRTNIQFSGTVGKKLKSIVMTSTITSEGKSTTISNLGVVLAQAGYKTLILDCDFRKPVLHKIFKLRNVGLTNCITSGENIEDFIQESNVEKNLFVLTSGIIPPNPSEILGSEEMESLIRTLEQRFDYVLIDMPPVMPVTDTLVLAGKVDGVIVVVEAERISPDIAKEMKDRLAKNGANILGVILNKIDIDSSSSYGYGYYQYYGTDEKN
jgi:capsular exopolysaccharide synthesis family protein